LMRSCKDIAEIISGSDYKDLPFWTRVSVRMHGLMCRCHFCIDYSKQVAVFREMARRWAGHCDEIAQDTSIELPAQAKDRIKDTLR